MIIKSDFKPFWLLNNPHLQTIFPRMMTTTTPKTQVIFENIELKDGDFVELVWLQAPAKEDAPLIVMLHGLGGNLKSHYVTNLFEVFAQYGLRAVLMHFRGSGEKPNRLLRTYHAGDTGDFQEVLQYLHVREPKTRFMAVGISMGGNVLLKWLGEQGQQNLIHKAVAISVPFKLQIAAETINNGFSQIYQQHMLDVMRDIYLRKMEWFECPFSKNDLLQVKNFWEYDDMVTAKIFGFKNAMNYYRSESCYRYLHDIQTTTLIIHAEDDPFMTPNIIPKKQALSQDICLELCEHGGHVGFIGDIHGKPVYWLKHRLIKFFLQE